MTNLTEIQKLQIEIDNAAAKRNAIITENTVNSDFQKIKRSFSYRKSTIIKARDIA